MGHGDTYEEQLLGMRGAVDARKALAELESAFRGFFDGREVTEEQIACHRSAMERARIAAYPSDKREAPR